MVETVDGGCLQTVGMRSVVAWFAQYQCTKCGQVPTSLVRLWSAHWSWWRTSSFLLFSQFTQMFYDKFKEFQMFRVWQEARFCHLCGESLPLPRVPSAAGAIRNSVKLSNPKCQELRRIFNISCLTTWKSKAPSLPSRAVLPGWMTAFFCCQQLV